jgi:hypothetical protein
LWLVGIPLLHSTGPELNGQPTCWQTDGKHRIELPRQVRYRVPDCGSSAKVQQAVKRLASLSNALWLAEMHHYVPARRLPGPSGALQTLDLSSEMHLFHSSDATGTPGANPRFPNIR